MHLLIVRPGAIGDTLLAFPVIQTLRAQYRDVHITLVANNAVLPLARASNLVEETYDYGDTRWSELFSFSGIQRLARRDQFSEIDRAICWLRDLDGIVERNLRALGIHQITVAPGKPAENEHVHIVEYLARTIGLATPGPFVFEFGRTRAAHADAPIAIHPGSGGARKCWPIASFVAVIRALWQRDIPVLLLTGPADHERLSTLSNQLGAPPRPTLLKTLVDLPLLELAQEVRACRGYLGNDAGITHLAAMLGLPTIALFGPSDPLIWRPCGPLVYVIQHFDLTGLRVDEVMYNVEALLLHTEKA